MSILSDVRRVWNGLRSIETLALWYAKHQDTSNTPNLLNLKIDSTSSFGDNRVSPLTDLSSYPVHMFYMVNNDTFFGSLAQQIENALFKNGWYIDRATDDDGNPLGNVSTVSKLTDRLKEIDYQDIIIKLFYARWLDGGGNALLFTRKLKNQLEFIVEPFFERGYPRVQLTVDDKHKLILKYEVVDIGKQPIYTLIPGENYFTHLRYSQGGDYRFSSNPAKKAVYWFMLKAYVGGAASSAFENGPQDQTILSPKYSELKTFIELLSGKDTSRIGDVSFSNLFKEITERGEIDRSIIRDIIANPRKQNTMLQMQVPYEVTKLDRNLQKLMADKIIEISNTEMQYALRSDRSLLDSRQSKYSNAEISKDSWNNYVLDPEKKYIEEITEKWILPVLDPDYNPELYPFRFGRDSDAESIAIYEAKTARNKSVAEILEKISFLPGVQYNFNTNQIEPIGQEPKKPVDNTLDNDEIVEESEEVRTIKKKEHVRTLAENILNSSDTRKFITIVGGAITRQLKKYNDKLLTKDSTSQALIDLPQDFPPINTTGLTVQTYKEQLNKVGKRGLSSFTKESKEKATQNITNSALQLLDDKSQMMIKGWESLDATQRQRLLQIYEEGYRGYKGMDDETIQQVNTILRNAVEDRKNITETSKRLAEQIPSISEGRARRIVNTEVSQSLAATRRLSFLEAGWKGHGWQDVNDDKVRPAHRQNTEQGVIPIDQAFEGTGTRSPAEEIDCRCDEYYVKEL